MADDKYQFYHDIKWYASQYRLHKSNQIKEHPLIESQLLEQYIETN